MDLPCGLRVSDERGDKRKEAKEKGGSSDCRFQGRLSTGDMDPPNAQYLELRYLTA